MKTKILLIAALVSTLYSCKRDVDKDPKIETIIAKSIAAFMCYTKASVLEIGSYEITDHGFVYSNNNGTFGIENGTKISLGLGSFKSDTFSTVFPFGNSYNNSQSYYVRAYLSNKKGTVYGSILSFEPMLMTLGSIIPASGKAGERITITGNNFSAKPEENTVKFNTSIAKVVEASSTKLVVEVPNGINIGYNYSSSVIIYISVGGQTVNSTYFTLLPTIIGFSPTSGTFGTSITISGENLYGSSVKFDNIAGYVSSTTSNSLTTTIPNNITSDKIKIKVINN